MKHQLTKDVMGSDVSGLPNGVILNMFLVWEKQNPPKCFMRVYINI